MKYIIFGLVIIIIVLYILYKRKITENEQILNISQDELFKQTKNKYKNEFDQLNSKKEEIENSIVFLKKKYTEDLSYINKNIHDQEEILRKIKETNQQASNDFIEKLELQKQQQLQVYNSGLESINYQAQIKRENIQESLQLLLDELEEYQSKVATINNEIKHRREIEEKTDFYRIQLDDISKQDIRLLESIRSQLHKQENLDKLIYDTYISKPVQEMIKRILSGETPSGIYMITRLKTGEHYVGKSTDIKNRWQQHCKSVFHCGTISHSTLHTIMEKDGIDNFTFEILEEVSKDKLGEREKYWIDFYQTKEFGLNERAGG